MKVRVDICAIVEVNDPVFEELKINHINGFEASTEQYNEAIKCIEKETGFLFYDNERDVNCYSPRITCVTDYEEDVDLLEG